MMIQPCAAKSFETAHNSLVRQSLTVSCLAEVQVGQRKRPRKRKSPIDDPDWGRVVRPVSSRRGAPGHKRESTPDTYHVEATQKKPIAPA